MNKKLLIIGLIASIVLPQFSVQAKNTGPTQATLVSPKGEKVVIISGTDVAKDYFKLGYVIDSKFKPLLGAVINQAPSLFETSLASAINSSVTSMTLVSGKDRSGKSLSGNICFTIDSGLTTTEFVCGVANGTSITSMTRGIAPDGVTSTSSLKFSHRYGSDVKVTDFPVLQQYGRILNGQDSLPNKLFYNVGVADTGAGASSTNIMSKAYIDSVGAGGFTAANASTTQGIRVLGTAPETIGVQSSSTGGIGIDGANGLYIKASSTSGLKTNSNGLYFDSSVDQNWTGTNTNMTIINSYIASTSISIGNLVMISTTTGAIILASASSTPGQGNDYEFIGIAKSSSSNGLPVLVQTSGVVTGLSGLVANKTYFVSNVAGQASTSMGIYPIMVGKSLSSTSILLQRNKTVGLPISQAAGTYIAPTDGNIFTYVQRVSAGNPACSISVNGVTVSAFNNNAAQNIGGSCSGTVRKGDTYVASVTSDGNTTVYFIPTN